MVSPYHRGLTVEAPPTLLDSPQGPEGSLLKEIGIVENLKILKVPIVAAAGRFDVFNSLITISEIEFKLIHVVDAVDITHFHPSKSVT
jgi:hypothetical protein